MTQEERDPVRRLPPGPHGLLPELVERNQRERLIAAMAEVCAERGYGETSVAEVAKRAGVSTASFYRQFKDRQECMLASFEELFGRLFEELERGCVEGSTPAERVRGAARVVAELLAADPPTARLLSVEVLAAGPDGVRAQQSAIDLMAARLRKGTAPAGAADPAWAAVAAMASLVGKRVVEGGSATAAELEALADLLKTP
ncbi:MAG: TetR/AcrR family transcriptional regulator [Solirubrobacterales bacterium]